MFSLFYRRLQNHQLHQIQVIQPVQNKCQYPTILQILNPNRSRIVVLKVVEDSRILWLIFPVRVSFLSSNFHHYHVLY